MLTSGWESAMAAGWIKCGFSRQSFTQTGSVPRSVLQRFLLASFSTPVETEHRLA